MVRSHAAAGAAITGNELPTVADFVPGYEANNWWGIAAPKATPAEIVDRLNEEINAACRFGRPATRGLAD
jgi:tripartite-type tricarboxylate transporter receptor subunit TctC